MALQQKATQVDCICLRNNVCARGGLGVCLSGGRRRNYEWNTDVSIHM